MPARPRTFNRTNLLLPTGVASTRRPSPSTRPRLLTETTDGRVEGPDCSGCPYPSICSRMHPTTEIQEASLEDAEGEVGPTGVGGSPSTSLSNAALDAPDGNVYSL